MAQIFYDHVSGRYFKSTMKQLHDWEVKLFSEYSNGFMKKVTHNYICENIFELRPVRVGDCITYYLPIEFELFPYYDELSDQMVYMIEVLHR